MALPSPITTHDHIAPPDYILWIDGVARELNEGLAGLLETRGRELVIKDVREILLADDPSGVDAAILGERAKALELEPLASLLGEVRP